jgi:hypothetical protein
MARIDWIERRLLNWARWRLTRGMGGLGYAGVNLAEAGTAAATDDPNPIPISDVEASETADALLRLNPPGLRLSVEEFYIGRGGVRDKCRRLCCGESTLYARIDQAHRQLADLLNEADKRRRAERERVEGVLRSARPVGV